MSDLSIGSEQKNLSASGSDCDAVCIDASRIYDSCGAKDCLRDLPVFFTEENQTLIESACSVRVSRVSVITSTVDVEPVAFHKGFYSVDMFFYFAVTLDVYTSAASIPNTVTGLSTYGKRVVLYGSDGCVKTFSSEDASVICADAADACECLTSCLPRATVQISDPMALSAKIVSCPTSGCTAFCGVIPECVTSYIGGDIAVPTDKYAAATIGIFTITQLSRNVQLLIPSYDFCVPRKECNTRTDDPCEVFSKIEFPTDSFFPPNSSDRGDSANNTKKGECSINCKCSDN